MINFRQLGLLWKSEGTAKRCRTCVPPLITLFLLACGLLFLNGCTSVQISGTIGYPEGYPAQAENREERPPIPPGHMPPSGKCRIWFTGRPPGQQPPPGDCYELKYHVPLGAVLVRG